MKKFLRKVLGIFFLVIIWSAIYMVFNMIVYGAKFTIKDIIYNIFNSGLGNRYTSYLWFLQNLIMFYLIFPVLKFLHDNNKQIYNYVFVLVAIFAMGVPLINNILTVVDNIFGLKLMQSFNFFANKYNPILNGPFIFFFMLGGYLFEKKEIFENKENRIKAVLIGAISAVLAFILGFMVSITQGKVVADNFNCWSIFTAVIVIGWYALTYKKGNNKNVFNELIQEIGKNTLGIYLIHYLFVLIVKKYFMFLLGNAFSTAIITTLIILLSYILIKIIKRIPIIHKLVEL